ncbi:SAF domain-containing protein [Streptomyces sp. T-3]|nr:SAF domain-containing protein [Streptomyces sp. T-3]
MTPTGAARRRPKWVWAGLLVVALSAGGFAVTVSALGQREPVLMVVRDVPAGHVFTAADLRSVKIAVDGGIAPIPYEQRAGVVGRRATVPLLAGALLTRGEVGSKGVYPPKGYSEISFAVAEGGAPPRLASGERVAVLDSAEKSAAGPQGKGEADRAAAVVVGTVTGVKDPASAGGVRVVSVLVETGAGRRASGIEEPRVLILPTQGREAP